MHINIKELAMVYRALLHWGPKPMHHRAHIIVDNSVMLAWINSKRGRDKTAIRLLQDIGLLVIKYNLPICATYVRSEENQLADSES